MSVKINLKVPLSMTGYGVCSKNIAKVMHRNEDIDLCVIPINKNNLQIEKSDIPEFKDILKNTEQPHYDGHSIKIWHQNDLMDHIGTGLKIGWPIFELDRFTDVEAHHIGSCDKIFVCSQWAKDVVVNGLYNRYKWSNLEKDIHVVPLGVDRSIFYNAPKNHTTTRFFNCGKWEIRKGHDVIIKAFERAFTKEDDVELYMMCNNPFPQVDNNAWHRYYKNTRLGEKVNLVSAAETHEEVAHIMRQMDCGVFPARAEGFNLELLECMSVGLHVITTDYSAHTEYCNEDNASLIEITDFEYAQDGIWFHKQGKWAKLGDKEIDAIAERMRVIHEYKQCHSSSINSAGIETAKEYSWENSVNIIKGIL